jgi:hypothetical protein
MIPPGMNEVEEKSSFAEPQNSNFFRTYASGGGRIRREKSTLEEMEVTSGGTVSVVLVKTGTGR